LAMPDAGLVVAVDDARPAVEVLVGRVATGGRRGLRWWRWWRRTRTGLGADGGAIAHGQPVCRAHVRSRAGGNCRGGGCRCVGGEIRGDASPGVAGPLDLLVMFELTEARAGTAWAECGEPGCVVVGSKEPVGWW
jgi:hypothetical protein